MNTDTDSLVMRSTLGFPVVGIGASAGGLNAILKLFENMPSDNGMAFVVVLHLSPKHESNVAKLLQSATKMSIQQVNDSVHIERNNVYVIPPSKNLLMTDGMLVLETLNRPRGRHIAIDLFLRTLAEAHAEKSIGIILSGTGSDGAVGLTRIKEKGGITVAQEPADAEYDGMPVSAINTGVVDVVLPLTEIPQKLIEFAKNIESIVLPHADQLQLHVHSEEAGDATAKAESDLAAIMKILRSRTGHDFSHYKTATVLRRIERRMQINCVPNLNRYLDYLEKHYEETPLLLQDMLISVTNFFRDREAFDTLEREIIPKIFDNWQDDEQIRAWVPGCATGEEAYSIAMLLEDQRALQSAKNAIQVFATDIDDQAIGVGRRGSYPESIVTDVSPARLRHFFKREDRQYRINKDIRDTVLFAAHNILRDPPFSRLHLISCRNLLIYLNRDIQERIFEMFHFSLLPGGYLFLGSAESAEAASNYFVPVDKKNRVYQAIGTQRRVHYIPTGPFRKEDAVPAIGKVREERPRIAFAQLHQELLQQYAPPSLLVNRDGDIAHVSGNAALPAAHDGRAIAQCRGSDCS